MKLKYAIIDKLHTLTAKEMDLLFYLAMHQEEKTGIVDGVYYREAMEQASMCRQSFYNALRGLERKQVISVRKGTEVDYTVRILGNAFPDSSSYREGYVSLNRRAFRTSGFRRLKAHEKFMLLEFLKCTHEGRGSMCREAGKLYGKYMQLLGVTKRVVRGYLHRLRKFFSIGLKGGRYHIAYLHSVFSKEQYGKAEEDWNLGLQVRKECRRSHISYGSQSVQDVVSVIKQYRPHTTGTGAILQIAMHCIRISVEGLGRGSRQLNAKYVHKLLRKGLLEGPGPI